MSVTARSAPRSDRGDRSRTRPTPRGDPLPAHECADQHEPTRQKAPTVLSRKDGGRGAARSIAKHRSANFQGSVGKRRTWNQDSDADDLPRELSADLFGFGSVSGDGFCDDLLRECVEVFAKRLI